MSPVSENAVNLSSVAPASAEQETGMFIGHENLYVPNSVVTNQPNMLGGEVIRAMPNMGLQPADYTFIPPSSSFTPAFVPDYTTTIHQTGFLLNPWSVFDFSVPLHYPIYPTDPMYNQGIPAQESQRDQQQYPVATEETGHQYDAFAAVPHPLSCHASTVSDISPHFVPYPCSANPFHGFLAPSMDDLTDSWYVCEYESSSDGTGQIGSFELVSPDSSPAYTTEYGPQDNSSLHLAIHLDKSDDSTISSRSARPSSRSPRTGVQKRTGKRKGHLTESQREQASLTRKIGACLHCKFQRYSCEPNPAAPEGPCLTCIKMKESESKKVIHGYCPCERLKPTAIVLFRSGGLKFTERPGWEGAAMKDLGPQDWASDEIHTIHVTLGLCDKPITLRARRFKPIKGDQLSRFWTHNGAQYETHIAAYALDNIQNASKVLEQHIEAHAYDAVKLFVEGGSRVHPHPLVSETYKAAWHHMKTVEWVSPDNVNARLLMQDLFRLWYATRNTLGSAWLLGEPETEATLGMRLDQREGYPFPGKISLPRLIAQQFDAINYNIMLRPWRTRVLNNLWKLMCGKIDPKVFYTVYLVVFILLHEISYASKDRYWHARMKKEQVRLRYDMELFMEELQEGANSLLKCWHYFRRKYRNFNPLDAEWEKVHENDEKDEKDEKDNLCVDIQESEKSAMRALAEASRDNRVEVTDAEKKGWEGLYFDRTQPSPLIWERDMHFVSQMFKDDWSAQKTWSRAWDFGQELSV
ncbi:hypothetical protein BKA67DRAFT_534117 [Truncatella angustata]|uniref:Zn(2)-C6 fungal-type domain-containing protein n=1 Tax=Truncatella angustata TaxID=152316 RepID=A0A9P8UNF1_9PEZI|nr:uncharacterized protein BKA67DRAFT_534117 [Truncatella angustata]KAH6655181.1 hypothetical protein BKA67DRAFT_534117 [Truncatella angustata]